jgi:hypothetical protein
MNKNLEDLAKQTADHSIAGKYQKPSQEELLMKEDIKKIANDIAGPLRVIGDVLIERLADKIMQINKDLLDALKKFPEVNTVAVNSGDGGESGLTYFVFSEIEPFNEEFENYITDLDLELSRKYEGGIKILEVSAPNITLSDAVANSHGGKIIYRR